MFRTERKKTIAPFTSFTFFSLSLSLLPVRPFGACVLLWSNDANRRRVEKRKQKYLPAVAAAAAAIQVVKAPNSIPKEQKQNESRKGGGRHNKKDKHLSFFFCFSHPTWTIESPL